MFRTIKVGLALVLLALGGGCAFQGAAVATSGAAAEVMPQRAIPAAASLHLSSELASLSRTVSPSYVCGAHTYPLSLASAIRQSIITTNEAAFSSVSIGESASQAAPGALRHISYDLEQLTARLDFAPGFWQARAQANVDLLLRVRVYDGAGEELLRAVVEGNGFGEAPGDCAAGAQALGTAATKAIERALEEYVYKVINSDQIGLRPDEGKPADPLAES